MAQLNDGQAGQPGRFRLSGFVQAALILATIVAAIVFRQSAWPCANRHIFWIVI